MSTEFSSQRVFVTGGAGFIGSHLVDRLCEHEAEVVVYDNLSFGRPSNISRWLKNTKLSFLQADLLKPEKVESSLSDCEVVFHLAANPEVRVGSQNPSVHYTQNVTATFNVLEASRKAGRVGTFAFTSSSTVYGEPDEIPTPENYSPLEPISVYGASKLASEALIVSYAHTYGFKAKIYRLANVIGPRMRHGVIRDFVDKLSNTPRVLEILGDGTQKKSYLEVEDCINALMIAMSVKGKTVEVFNVGSKDQTNVRVIADIVCEEMNLQDVEYVLTGGVDGGRGWKGDVKTMLLDIGKLEKLGWQPKLNSNQAVRRATRSLLSKTS